MDKQVFLNEVDKNKATQPVILALIDKLIEAFKSKLGDTFDKFIPQIKGLFGILNRFFNIDKFIEILNQLIASLINASKEAIADFLAGIPIVKITIELVLAKVKDGIANLNESIREFISKVFGVNWEKFDAKIKEIYDDLKKAFEKFAEKAKEVWYEVVQHFEVFWSKVKDFLDKYVAGQFIDEVPIEVERNMMKFYQGSDSSVRITSVAQARRAYNKMVATLEFVLGEEEAKKELARLQTVYPNNYVRQAAEVKLRTK